MDYIKRLKLLNERITEDKEIKNLGEQTENKKVRLQMYFHNGNIYISPFDIYPVFYKGKIVFISRWIIPNESDLIKVFGVREKDIESAKHGVIPLFAVDRNILENYLKTKVDSIEILDRGKTVKVKPVDLEFGKTLMSPQEAKLWKSKHISLSEALLWKSYGFSPDEAELWIKSFWNRSFQLKDLSPEDAYYWKVAGFSPEEAAEWAFYFKPPKEGDRGNAKEWRDKGFSPKEAYEWMVKGIYPDEVEEFMKEKNVTKSEKNINESLSIILNRLTEQTEKNGTIWKVYRYIEEDDNNILYQKFYVIVEKSDESKLFKEIEKEIREVNHKGADIDGNIVSGNITVTYPNSIYSSITGQHYNSLEEMWEEEKRIIKRYYPEIEDFEDFDDRVWDLEIAKVETYYIRFDEMGEYNSLEEAIEDYKFARNTVYIYQNGEWESLEDIEKEKKIQETKTLKERLTLKDLNPPGVVIANTYFWTPGGNSKTRRSNEERHLEKVYDWLHELNEKYNLNLTIVWSDNDIVIYDEDGDEIGYFSYYESAQNVYKRQNFKFLLDLIKKKMGESKTLKEYKRTLSMKLDKIIEEKEYLELHDINEVSNSLNEFLDMLEENIKYMVEKELGEETVSSVIVDIEHFVEAEENVKTTDTYLGTYDVYFVDNSHYGGNFVADGFLEEDKRFVLVGLYIGSDELKYFI